MNKTTIKGLTNLQDSLVRVFDAVCAQVRVLAKEEDELYKLGRMSKTCNSCGHTAHNAQVGLTGDQTERRNECLSNIDELEDIEDNLQEYIDAVDMVLTSGYESTISFLEEQYPEIKI